MGVRTDKRLALVLTTPAWLAWCQDRVTQHHYLRRPVDPRCTPMAYVVRWGTEPLGCLIFGRPESTRCYTGKLTYGSLEDVGQGKAQYSRWEILNLARVWLDPRLQDRGGPDYVQNAASQVISQALKRVGYDYLCYRPPVYLDEPYAIRVCLSYCDTRRHRGTLYQAAGFTLARTAKALQTWIRPVRPLRHWQRDAIERLSEQSPRGRQYRAKREQAALYQLSLLDNEVV